MKYVVDTITDGGSILLFDPLSFPENFDNIGIAKYEVWEELDRAGHICWLPTEGDADWTLHAFIDDDPPHELLPFMRQPNVASNFRVSSSKVYFCGEEFTFRNTERFDSAMGGFFPMANGVYKVTTYTMEYSKRDRQRAFDNEATPKELRHQLVDRFLFWITLVTTACTLLAAPLVAWNWWLRVFVPLWIVTITLSIIHRWLFSSRPAYKIKGIVESRLPDIVATFERADKSE